MSTQEGSDKTSEEGFWKQLAIRYWYIIMIFGIIMVGGIVGAILTLDWYVKTSAIGGYGTWTFDQFSLGEFVFWWIFLILWMLLFVGLPVLAAGGAVAAIVWVKVLPPDVKEAIKSRPKGVPGGKQSGGGGAIGFLLFVGLCLKVWLDGNWLTKFGSLPYNYFVQSLIIVSIWGLIIFGIPAAIITTIWLVTQSRKTA